MAVWRFASPSARSQAAGYSIIIVTNQAGIARECDLVVDQLAQLVVGEVVGRLGIG